MSSTQQLEPTLGERRGSTGSGFLKAAHLPFFGHLSPWLRALLVTDGNVTDLLAAYHLEAVGIRKLGEQIVLAPFPDNLGPGEPVLERRVVLVGENSQRPYVYAEARAALDRLPRALVDDLRASALPLGRAWRAHRLETFKEPAEVVLARDEVAAAHLSGVRDLPLLTRRYRVVSGGQVCLVVRESFPLTRTAAARLELDSKRTNDHG